MVPAESAHPGRNCWHPGSAADSRYGKTSGPLSAGEVKGNW